MRKLLLLIILLSFMIPVVNAMEFSAPPAPDAAQKYLPEKSSSFGADLWHIIKNAILNAAPDIAEATRLCLSLVGIVLLSSVLQCFSGTSSAVVETVATLSIGTLLLQPSNALLQLGIQTASSLSDYGKLLLPVMTAAFAAQGGATASAALYTGTVVFNTVISIAIKNVIVPTSYVYVALSIAGSVMSEPMLKHLRKLIKWIMTWSLKIAIYLFTGYLGITRVVSGAVDASALKAAKIAISGMVPVVGKIVSDASETILVSAGIMKNATGVYGMLAILAILIGPFFKIGVQYLLLKVTAAVCGVLGGKGTVSLIQDFSVVMGFILAAIGTVCLLLIISTVCFMRGVA